MKALLLSLALLMTVVTSALAACPKGYYACGQNSALCCPK